MGSQVNFDYWTKERVINGLERFVRDIVAGDETKLPTNLYQYTNLVPDGEKGKRESERLYPPTMAVLRYFDSFAAAWWSFGYLVEITSSAKKYHMTDEIKERLIQIYEYPFKAKERPKDLPGVKGYARELGLPEHVLSKWAVELGLSHLKEAPWNEEEIEILDTFGYMSVPRIGIKLREKGYTRSDLGINLMRKRRMSHKATPYYSVNALAQLFGIDAHGVKAWIDKGWLKFVFKGTRRSAETKQNGDTRLVHVDWIYDFIVKHPTEIRFRQVDQLWFLSIVTKGDVKMILSDPSRISQRSECQQVEAPIEWSKHTPRMKAKRAAAASNGNGHVEDEVAGGLPYLKPKEHPHGTNTRYVANKCRCAECTDARRVYQLQYQKDKREGKGNPRVPADNAKKHIEDLGKLGIGYLRISKLGGVNHNVVWKIKTGERKNIQFETEQKILAVTVEMFADSSNIDAAETWEKITWVLSQGMSKTAFARRLGSPNKSTSGIQIGKKQVHRSTAKKVEEIFQDVKANGVRDEDRPKLSGRAALKNKS